MTLRPLRIAHIDTERTWRGGEQQVFSLVKGLNARGHTNYLVAREGSALHQKAEKVDWPMFLVQPFAEWDFIAAHRVNRWLRSEKIDLVHAHTAHAVALAAFSTVGTRIPVVVTRRVDFHLKKNFLSRWKYRRAKKIIAISNAVREVMIGDGIPADRIAVVQSGVDFDRFRAIQPAGKSDFNVPENSIVIGQVAALADHKDQATFLRAFALVKQKMPSAFAVLIGDGELKQALRDLALQLGISDAVRWLGFRDDALRLAAGFDVFCLSSHMEGLGTSILDAMALGVPVVATRVGGIPEMIEDGVSGFLSEPRHPEELAEKLLHAANLGWEKRSITDAARARARDFSIENTVLGTESVYETVL